MEYELLSCPHCEGSGKLKTGRIIINGHPERVAWVYCTKCKCRTNYFRRAGYDDYIEMAAIAWNMRVEDWEEDDGDSDRNV